MPVSPTPRTAQVQPFSVRYFSDDPKLMPAIEAALSGALRKKFGVNLKTSQLTALAQAYRDVTWLPYWTGKMQGRPLGNTWWDKLRASTMRGFAYNADRNIQRWNATLDALAYEHPSVSSWALTRRGLRHDGLSIIELVGEIEGVPVRLAQSP